MKPIRIHPPLFATIFLCLARTVLADPYAQEWPVNFAKLDGLVAKAGGLTLISQFKQPPGQPIVVECENASAVSLWGADTATARDGAGGGLVLRHPCGLVIDFTSVDAGHYRLWVRVWSQSGPCGPADTLLDGKNVGPLQPSCSGAPSGWTWVSSQPFQLEPGAHRITISGTTILWGANLDRMVLARADAPAPADAGPPATSCALRNGFAESDWIAADGVTRWVSVNATVATNGSKIRWKARQRPADDWSLITDLSLVGLDPKQPIQFRLEADANAAGTAPWIGPVSVRFEGAPRTINLPASGVRFTELADGGALIRAENYEATFASDGAVTRLRVNGQDAISPRQEGKGGSRLMASGGSLLTAGKPELQANGTLMTRGDDSCLTWTFLADSILLDTVCYRHDVIFALPVPTNVVRVIDARTGRDASGGGLYEKASPQYFFANGASVLVDDDNQWGGSYGARCDKDLFGTPGLTVAFWWNAANPWHKRLVLHAKPTIGDALVMSAQTIPADANYRASEAVQLAFPARLLFGMRFQGKAELACEQEYPDPPPGKVAAEQEISIDDTETPITWSVKPPKPGLYRATLRLLNGTNVVHRLDCHFCYGMDAAPPPSKPADFDAFWAETMKKLAAVPMDVETVKHDDVAGGTQSVLRFKTINGRPAWAVVRVPAKPGKYPAVLGLPPVGTGPPLYDVHAECVNMGVEVRGYDPTLPEADAAKKSFLNYCGTGNLLPNETREQMWLYYAYCTIARAYDILAAMPEVDPKRIYITGVSQGGGLTLAAAALRPQNAGALAIVPGLCRLDWRASNGGGWGPAPAANGPERARQAADISYFDDCNLVPRIRSRVAIAVGLIDDHTPPHAAIDAFYLLSNEVREKRLLVNPWGGHGSWPELDKIIPGWIAEDANKRGQ